MSGAAQRLEAEATNARAWGLRPALRALSGTLSLLQTGAHPDDESSGLLALLVRKHGMSVSYACATRGEGGQNALGAERGDALGVVRVAEMEAAAARLGISLHWLSDGPADPLRDFGFAKSGTDTLRRWGRGHALERLVRCIRHVRPDILCPTFLDVEGQHGHHRAMTELTAEAFGISGDASAFPAHASEGLSPWAPTLLYLPAWSGSGKTYDDDTRPPAGHVGFDIGLIDPDIGVPYARIGEWSRVCHASQEMGVWVEAGPQPVSLHLAARHDGSTAIIDRIGQTLPATIGEWAQATGSSELADAQAAIDEALAADARTKPVAAHLDAALQAVERCRLDAPWLARKKAQIARAIALARTEEPACPPRPIYQASPPASFAIPAKGVARPTGARVAYFGAGFDLMESCLAALNIDVVGIPEFDPEMLADGGFSTVLVGIRAFERRADLRVHADKLHAFVRGGGHLVTLYHRPGHGWDPARMPTARIEIGQPSIRWRVCDAQAPVEAIAPDHRLLSYPNAIGPADWDGWQGERGLYFPRSWDPAYVPLLRVTEQGEAPLLGGLLSGRFGKGAHTHVALALHREIEFGTPGALRLLCNLVAPAT